MVDDNPEQSKTVVPGEGNDSLNVDDLLKPEGRRRRRDAPIDSDDYPSVEEQIGENTEQQYTDAQGVRLHVLRANIS